MPSRTGATCLALIWLLVFSSVTRAQGPVKIGFIYPDSGFAAQLGLDLRDGFLLYWNEVGNKAGGRPVEVHLESNTSCKADEGPTKARKLVEQDRVQELRRIHCT